jgi:hypothetical protein
VTNLPLKGIRIGVNGSDNGHGQAYVPIDTTVGANYVAGTGELITQTGTVIGLEKGPLLDEFFLSFERIGDNSNPRPDPAAPTPATPVDLPEESDLGLRTFDELNATLSQVTGVPQTNTRVAQTYDLVKQALPAVEKLGTFGPAQQTALAQLAIQYCNQMVDNATLRTAFFGSSLNPSAPATSTFGTAGAPNNANRDIVTGALLTKGKNTGLEWDPDDSVITTELDNLINRLVAGPTGGASGGTGTVMKAACGAVLGSGTTLIQ